MPWTSITRRVPPMQHDLVPVGIREEGHVADARVENVAVEDDALLLELSPRVRDVRHAEGKACVVRRAKRPADRLEAEQVQKAVVAQLEFREARVAGQGQAERLAVELLRALHVGDGDRPEVDVLDDHAYGA